MTQKEIDILRAAEDEFFKCGYDGTSTAVIAKAAGMTHAMVNYYFRTKENLFMQILDNHVSDFLSDLKLVMNMDDDVSEVVCNFALVIFDRINADRKFPFILQDISRTHPQFIKKYHQTLVATYGESIARHSERFSKLMEEGKIIKCSLKEMYDTIIMLSASPFINIPVLINIAGWSEKQVDEYLVRRREEMVRILKARYFGQL